MTPRGDVQERSERDHDCTDKERRDTIEGFVGVAHKRRNHERSGRSGEKTNPKHSARNAEWTLKSWLANAQDNERNKLEKQTRSVEHQIENNELCERQPQRREPGNPAKNHGGVGDAPRRAAPQEGRQQTVLRDAVDES